MIKKLFDFRKTTIRRVKRGVWIAYFNPHRYAVGGGPIDAVRMLWTAGR